MFEIDNPPVLAYQVIRILCLAHALDCIQDAPTEYKLRSVWENSSPELIREFYWDDPHRMTWDPMLSSVRTVAQCPKTGAQIVHWVRKVSTSTVLELHSAHGQALPQLGVVFLDIACPAVWYCVAHSIFLFGCACSSPSSVRTEST